MKKLFLLFVFTFCVVAMCVAQSVAINTTGTPASTSAMLDVSSTTKGFLLPRMTAAQRIGIANPAIGLQVFQTDATTGSPSGLYFFNGTNWLVLSTGTTNGSVWQLNGNSGTNAATHFLGTTDAVDLKLSTFATPRLTIKSTGEVGIGTVNPNGWLGLVRGNNNIDQPILRIDDGKGNANAATVLLFNSGNNKLIDASTIGEGTMMRLSRGGTNTASGDGLVIENKGIGSALNVQVVDGNGSALFAQAKGIGGVIRSTAGLALRTDGNGAALFSSVGNNDAVEINMLSTANGNLTTVNGLDITVNNTGTAVAQGIAVTVNSSGPRVTGISSQPAGPSNAIIQALEGLGDIVITGRYLQGSDRKLKKNVQALPSVLDKIMNLKPSNYEFKNEEFDMNFPKGKQNGLIAQEVQSIFPELVENEVISAKIDPATKKQIRGEVSFLGVNYFGFVPILIKGVQEQQLQIQSLQSENAELKKELQAIKVKLGL